jgi:GntR family phosphonate transport system transcriptional regulator
MTDASPITLTRGEGVALWRQIAATLRDEIGDRRIAPGARLPTEFQLAERFAVNRHTVRRAVAALEEAGLVRVEQGRGTFVRSAVIDYTVGKRTRFSENLRKQALSPGGRLVDSGVRPATDAEARGLGLRAGTGVVFLELVGLADGLPISYATHCFPARRFDGLIAAFEASGSISAALGACGVANYSRLSTRLVARLPEAREAELLEMPRAQPLLVSEAVNVDEGGARIEYGVARFAGGRVQIVVDSQDGDEPAS